MEKNIELLKKAIQEKERAMQVFLHALIMVMINCQARPEMKGLAFIAKLWNVPECIIHIYRYTFSRILQGKFHEVITQSKYVKILDHSTGILKD